MQSAMQPDMQQRTSFDIDRAAKYLAARECTLDFYPLIDSTMHVAHQLAEREEIRSGSAVVADVQTAGRGRLDRRWDAPSGSSLLTSILVKGPGPIEEITRFPMLAGLAVKRTIEALQLPDVAVGIKWPNDLLLRSLSSEDSGAEGKVAGILIESRLRADGGFGHVIVGIGINVSQQRADLPIVAHPAPQPTSLLLAGGTRVDRTDLFLNLWEDFALLAMLPTETLRRAWRDTLWTLGRRVDVVHSDGSTLAGTAIDVDDRGGLIIRDEAGTHHVVHSGDVSLSARPAP